MFSIYDSRLLYHLSMRALYGRHFEDRYRTISAEIAPHASVVDLCAGDSYLYVRHLQGKPVRYIGLDISPKLIAWAKKQGVDARRFDLWTEPIPSADYVVLQASLYQFYDDAYGILARLIDAARCRVIVAEPVRNFSSSGLPLVAWLNRRLVTPKSPVYISSERRFGHEELVTLFQKLPEYSYSYLIPGGREIVGIFDVGAERRVAHSCGKREHTG